MRRTDEATLADLPARLREAIVPLARQLRRQVTEGFTPTEISIIGSINRHRLISMGELAAHERLSAPVVSKVVTSLEECGIVERVADEQDRRVCRVRTTRKGAQWIEQARERRDAWLTQRLATLSATDKSALVAALPAIERLNERDD